MRKTSIYRYYSFGYNYYILREGMVGQKVQGKGSLQETCEEFFETLRELNLPVTLGAAGPLEDILKNVKSLPEDARVPDPLARGVAEAVDRLDVTLDAELRQRSAFVVTPKRFDLGHLLETPWHLLAEGTFGRLPPIVQFDFTSACQCIGFGVATAAAFHLMRCVEGMLRAYYCSEVKRDRVDPMNWGPMIAHLRRRKKHPPAALIDHLDHLRANFRNPTQHPEARYDMEEAQDLLAVSLDVLNRMARALSAKSTPAPSS